MKDSQQEYPNVTRIEMIDSSGRAYTAYDATDVQILLQDDGRTLKIVHTGTAGSMPSQEHITSFGEELGKFIQGISEEDLAAFGLPPGVFNEFGFLEDGQPAQEEEDKDRE